MFAVIRRSIAAALLLTAFAGTSPTTALAQNGQNGAAPPADGTTAPAAITPPPDYVVGVEDVLGIVFFREKELSSEVIVRPDGRISLPLLNDIDVAGLTPDQVRERIVDRAKEFVDQPTATVVVRQIHSRKVFITGMVFRPGPFPLMQPTTVLQLIALAGGLQEFADGSGIVVVRTENGRQLTFTFNFNDVKNRRKLEQNILLKPGDVVIVP